MKKILFSAIAIAFFTFNLFAQNNKTVEFKNGFWYNGKNFTAGTWYSHNGLLTKKAPAKIDSTIDLDNRWVVPPLGDAHVTCITGNSTVQGMIRLYMAEGFFYLRILGNTLEDRETALKLLNKPKSPDAAFANGGLTCTLGQPFMDYEPKAWDIKNPEMAKQRYDQIKLNRKMLGNGYWFIDNKDALGDNWKKIEAQKPDVISIYLIDVEKSGGKEGKGLDEKTAKAIIKKAKKADLPVVAFVENWSDVRLGIKLGVNGFANLPKGDFDLSASDLSDLAKKNITITPQFAQLQAESIAKPEILEKQKIAFKKLVDANVPLAIGSNDLSRTARSEINYWKNLAPAENSKMLKYLCEITPKAIFPNRKVGQIAEGFEASFLVLNDDPLQNVMKLRAISFMVKNGGLIQIEAH